MEELKMQLLLSALRLSELTEFSTLDDSKVVKISKDILEDRIREVQLSLYQYFDEERFQKACLD